jgi:hypothetical protein
MDVIVRKQSGEERRAMAPGRDIYAVSALLLARAVDRVLTGRTAGTRAIAPGSLFDAREFLETLAPRSFTLEFLGR